MIDPITTQKIKDAADIVEVVSDYVHLTRRGANYIGLCPFHNERTPSFSVNKQRNFCYCFSCKKGGSPVNFIMEKEGLSYHDALLQLARKYGIEVNERELTDKERAEQTERETMLIANEWALKHMESNLFDTEEGRDIGLQYFMQRGVTQEAIKKFRLGYALDRGSELTDSARHAGFDLDVMKRVGLVGTTQQGKDYDRFRGRVIFPIMNSAGKVIAFGGRDLKGGLSKYINSPESSVYKKSNELYGIYQARADMVKEDKCFLVEGYLDVIGMWQSGMRNTVASSGTALTDGQIALIHRFTNNITLIYDGDAAGIKAALRGIDMLLSHKMNVKVLLLPDGDDPDSFAKKHTPEEFKAFIKEHETDIIRFKAEVMLEDINRDPQSRINAINSVVQSLACIQDTIARDIYIQECSKILGIPDVTVAKAVAKSYADLSQKWKRERAIKQIESERSEQSATHSISSAEGENASSESNQPHNNYYQEQPYAFNLNRLAPQSLPLEESVLRQAIKYGFFPICNYVNEEGIQTPLYVIEYIDDELAADNINFTEPAFRKTFDTLKKIKNNFLIALKRFKEKQTDEIATMRKMRIKEFAQEDLSVSEITRKEKFLDKELEDLKAVQIKEFTKNYAGIELASHEDSEIRMTATRLLQERHQLSTIYLRDGQQIENPEDALDIIIPRSLTEWKEWILGQLLNKEMAKLANNKEHPLSPEEEKDIQNNINTIFKMRKQIAKTIGDRTLDPRPPRGS